MWRLLICFFLLVVVSTSAQIAPNPDNRSVCTLRVDVVFQNGSQAGSGIRVELLQGILNASAEEVEMTNSSGSAEFPNLVSGDYRVQVSGQGLENTSSSVIHIDDGRVFASEMVVVRKIEQPSNGEGKGASADTVTMAELKVPQKASDEFARGDAEMQHNKWKKAAEHFSNAVAIYPQYASAYYNLSVAYFQLKEPDQQREALEKALTINGNLVPALVSLAHLEVADHESDSARALLDKAVSADPTNVEALALRVRVDFIQGQYQQAVDDTQKVHALPHQGYASVHYTAAGALQQLNRIPEMIVQLQLFLQEDPQNPRASYVRQTIAQLQGQSH